MRRGQLLFSPIEISTDWGDRQHTGRLNFSLTRLGGWAHSFVKADAAAFVGGLYSVGDSGARTFAQHLYNHLLDGKPLAESARLARRELYKAQDPTWLAYSVYGHPMAPLGR